MKPTYKIVVHGPSRGLECLLCGRLDYNPRHIEELFCGWCSKRHEPQAGFTAELGQLEEARKKVAARGRQ